MKKFTTITSILLISITGHGQDSDFPGRILMNDPMLIQIPATLIAIYLIATFILTMMRLILDYRIKCKLIEKGVPDNLVAQFLQTTKKDYRNLAIKWFSILISLGIGLLLISFFPPLGLQSLGIMACCIASGFLGYYYFMKRSGHEQIA